MEEKEINAILIDKLTELNDLEIKKSKVLAVIFQKTTREIMSKKMQSLKSNFKEQAEFYGQNLEDYDVVYQEIMKKYEDQLSQILIKYHEIFSNIYLELQEAECNQKIAITNLKKSYDTKQEILNLSNSTIVEEFERKINACLQKKKNYDMIIKECEKELDNYRGNIENQINSLFADKLNQIALKEEGAFAKLIQKIKNMFSGKTKFKTYVIEPIDIELEMRDSKLPDIINDMHQDIVRFVAKIKQAKAQTNEIFNQMM